MTATTTRRATIFHGYGATPEDHWFAWLADQLDRAGVPTQVPALPDPSSPDPARWSDAVSSAIGTPGSGSIVIAHSLGCLAALRHLRSLSGGWRLGTLVLVSGFIDRLPALPGLDEFIGDGVDLSGLREHIGSITVLRSDDDPFVPVGHTDRLARCLDVPALVLPGAGHFLAADGVTSLPQALEAIVGGRRSSSAPPRAGSCTATEVAAPAQAPGQASSSAVS